MVLELQSQNAGYKLPLVSILIPAYNSQEWIADTISSALNQSWLHTEIIVVDDGSTDNTASIARSFEGKGVRVLTQPNQGAATARNTAYSKCTGDYIQWLDSDDILDRDKIASQMELVLKGIGRRFLISGAWGNFTFHTNKAVFCPTGLWRNLSPVEWLFIKMSQNAYMQTANWLVSRELSEKAGPWDIRMLSDDDGEYFRRVLLASEGVHFVPESRVYYRRSGTGGLNYIGSSHRKIEAQWISMKLNIQSLRNLEKSKRIDQACLSYLRTWLHCFYPEYTNIVCEAQAMAREFGSELGEPHLSWKYLWIRRLLGWKAVKTVQYNIQNWRWQFEMSLQRILFHFYPSSQ